MGCRDDEVSVDRNFAAFGTDLAARLDRAAQVAELEARIQSCLQEADALLLWQTAAYLDSARCFVRVEAKLDCPSSHQSAGVALHRPLELARGISGVRPEDRLPL